MCFAGYYYRAILHQTTGGGGPRDIGNNFKYQWNADMRVSMAHSGLRMQPVGVHACVLNQASSQQAAWSMAGYATSCTSYCKICDVAIALALRNCLQQSWSLLYKMRTCVHVRFDGLCVNKIHCRTSHWLLQGAIGPLCPVGIIVVPLLTLPPPLSSLPWRLVQVPSHLVFLQTVFYCLCRRPFVHVLAPASP